jgi:hypothetical protein
MRVSEIGRAAAEFTNLRDRFRQAANITRSKGAEDLQTQFETLMDRMDAVRNTAPAIPEWCFKRARKKINAGDYQFAVDEQK